MEQAKQAGPASGWRRGTRIGAETCLILMIVGLIAAFLAPVIKGPSPEVRKQMQAAEQRRRAAATAPAQRAPATRGAGAR
jgi:hypothetical protein